MLQIANLYVISTLFLYFTYFVSKPTPLNSALALAASLIVWLITNKPKISINPKLILPIFLYLPIVFGIALVLSPLVKNTVLNNITFYSFPGAGDYYKHSFVITAILQKGLPPVHPFYPPAVLSYYYGYYLLPTALTTFSPFSQLAILYFFVLLTIIYMCFLHLHILIDLIKSKFLRLISIGLFVFGWGFDIVAIRLFGDPNIFNTHHIEAWSFASKVSFENLFVDLLWVPQHTLAGMLTILLGYRLLYKKEKLSPLYIACFLVIISMTSLFVGMFAAFCVALLFISHGHLRKKLFMSGIFSLPLAYLFIHGLGSRNSTAYFSLFSPVNSLQVLLDWGPLMLFLPIYLLISKQKKYLKVGIFFVYIPLLLTWVIKSVGFNDFGMRFVLAPTILFTFLVPLTISKISSKLIQFSLIILTIASILVSAGGFVYEYYYRYKERRVYDAYTSELVTYVRHHPELGKIMPLNASDAIYLIPSLGFRPMYSGNLYEAGVYITGSVGYEHQALDQFVHQLNTYQFVDNKQSSLESKQSEVYKNLITILNQYPADTLLVERKRYVKEGINPAYIILKNSQSKETVINEYYSTFSYPEVVKNIQNLNLTFGKSSEVLVTNRTISLPQGLLMLTACADPKGDPKQRLRLDFERHYELFDAEIQSTECIGGLFYNPTISPLFLSRNNFGKLYFQTVSY